MASGSASLAAWSCSSTPGSGVDRRCPRCRPRAVCRRDCRSRAERPRTVDGRACRGVATASAPSGGAAQASLMACGFRSDLCGSSPLVRRCASCMTSWPPSRLFATALSLVALACASSGLRPMPMLESASPAVGVDGRDAADRRLGDVRRRSVARKSSIEVVVSRRATDRQRRCRPAIPRRSSSTVPLLAAATYEVRWAAATEDGHSNAGAIPVHRRAARQPGAARRPARAATTSGGPPPAPRPRIAPTGTAQPSASPAHPGDASGGLGVDRTDRGHRHRRARSRPRRGLVAEPSVGMTRSR